MWPLVHEIKPRVVILDMRAVPDLEYTALAALTAADETLKSAGVTLWLVAIPRVSDVIERAPLGERLGRDRMFPKLAQAIAGYSARGRMSPKGTSRPRFANPTCDLCLDLL